ncbi:hypothetical protein E2C01_068963 [Portunus trituberculatus]|uniref:Uncharacterized protein n=1 Tax=Portunus trituberculatus TaxID=210409 RepID=A0A5B7HZC3_PORTR|nr:hypothetical protein [Portunus trituberculatus]
MDRIRTRAPGGPSDPKARIVSLYHSGPIFITISHIFPTTTVSDTISDETAKRYPMERAQSSLFLIFG